MIIKNDIHTNIEIYTLDDLKKLKPLMEGINLKINKSHIARKLGVDPRMVGKYINGYVKPTTRNRTSKIDTFYPIIKKLLSEESIQIFYYKRVLWQFVKDNHDLDCAQSSFHCKIADNL